MDVTLYKNFSVENKISKNLTQVAKYAAVQMVEPVNDAEISLRVTIPSDTVKWDNVNYFEWDDAYYFVESVNFVANGLSEINGRMDLLMTYRTAINGLQVRLNRSSSHGSSRLEDDLRHYSISSSKAVVAFPRPFAETQAGGSYVFVTSQKGYQS